MRWLILTPLSEFLWCEWAGLGQGKAVVVAQTSDCRSVAVDNLVSNGAETVYLNLRGIQENAKVGNIKIRVFKCEALNYY